MFFLHLESLCHTGLDPGWTNQNKGAQVPTTPILVQKIPKSAPKRYALLLVDIFTKYVDVVPMVNNQAPSVVSALKQGITNMGGKPKTIYSDGEGALSTDVLKTYLEEDNIRLIQTRGHAAYAERHIRTIKDMLFKRLEFKKLPTEKWTTLLPDVLKEYNTKMVHSSHNFTPTQAKQTSNEAIIKGRLEVGRIKTRNYPPVRVGSTVKVFQKKDKLDKANMIGVIAQDLEASGMNGLIDERYDHEGGKDLETTSKAVKYSVLYMKAIKALQEAMTRIETLESSNTALAARIKTLEDA